MVLIKFKLINIQKEYINYFILFVAAEKGNNNVAKLLISYDAGVDSRDYKGETPLQEGRSIKIERDDYLSMNILIYLFHLKLLIGVTWKWLDYFYQMVLMLMVKIILARLLCMKVGLLELKKIII